MKLGDKEYDALVQKLGHSHADLSPQEIQGEVAAIQDGAKAVFKSMTGQYEGIYMPEIPSNVEEEFGIKLIEPKKRRGRPPGVKNRPKEVK